MDPERISNIVRRTLPSAPRGLVSVSRLVTLYGKQLVNQPIDEVVGQGRFTNIYADGWLERTRAAGPPQLERAVRPHCPDLDIWRVLDACQPHAPTSGTAVTLRQLICCHTRDLRDLFFGLVISGGGWSEQNERALERCLDATLHEIFDQSAGDLTRRDLTDDRAVTREQIQSLAACFYDHGLICQYLFGVTLLDVVYDPREIASRAVGETR